jgi:hypothetical protein
MAAVGLAFAGALSSAPARAQPSAPPAAPAAEPWTRPPATEAPAASEESLRAALHGVIALVPPKCASAGLNVEAFVNLLSADLRSDGVERVSLAGAEPTASESVIASITLEAEPCVQETRLINVTIEDQATRKRVVRQIPMKDVAEALRPRAMALAVAELLRASLLELMTPEAPPPAVRLPAEVKSAVARRLIALAGAGAGAGREVPSPAMRYDISVMAVWHASIGGHAALFGGRGAVGTLLWPSGLVRIDLGALAGSTQDALGDVSVGEGEAGIAVLWTSPRDATVSGAFGARSEMGLAWVNGHASAQQTSSAYGSGFVFNALLLGEVAWRIAPSWRLALELESGASVVPLVALADSRPIAGIQGGMVGVAFGVAQLR